MLHQLHQSFHPLRSEGDASKHPVLSKAVLAAEGDAAIEGKEIPDRLTHDFVAACGQE
jgi:hypothetical protein